MATGARVPSLFDSLDTFTHRHVGPDDKEADKMLAALGYSSMDHFIRDAVPAHIRIDPANVSDEAIPPLSESELLRRAGLLAAQNKVYKSYIGMGYHTAVVPPVILRNVSAFRQVQR
jgi:glycine cleavage system P protein (glycine dehydrogenase)